jgi:ABC-type sugar transport system substrate-binding protein
MRKTLTAFFTIALLVGSVATATAQDAPRWDGSDDLPVTPLPCPGSDEAPPVPEALPYDGGVAVDPPDLAGQQIKLVDIPKLKGIPFFNATGQGTQEAAADLGNVEVINDGTTQANIDEQIALIDQYITSGVDGILFAANDPVAISEVLKKALEQGIHVVGYDANSNPDAREWFINQAAFNAIAKTMIDKLVEEKGDDVAFGIVTSTFTTPNQARWIAEMSAYTAKCYPNLKWLETVEAQEDQKLSFDQATSLLNKYSGEIGGLLAMTSIATPASADAVTQAGLCGEVGVVGLGLPNAMKPFVNDGCVKSVVLWNPIDLGYAAVQVMRAVVDGTLAPGATSFEAGRLGELQVINGSEVLLGDPFVWTAENINDYDF